MMRSARLLCFATLLLAVSSCFGTCSEEEGGETLRLATTTSVADSGLLERLKPAFEKETGYTLDVAAVGSGKALARLAAGEADVAITHAPAAERRAVAAGEASRHTPIMYNAFVIVGPADRAELVAGAGSVETAVQKIASSGERFISRGDDSGTHVREQALWRAAGVSAEADFIVAADAGMADTLRRASSEEAFALTDRGTFLTLRDGLELAIVFQGDDALRNVYSVLEPGEGGSGTGRAGGRAFVAFLRSKKGRMLIGEHGVEEHGEPLFTPMP